MIRGNWTLMMMHLRIWRGTRKLFGKGTIPPWNIAFSSSILGPDRRRCLWPSLDGCDLLRPRHPFYGHLVLLYLSSHRLDFRVREAGLVNGIHLFCRFANNFRVQFGCD
ncbi:hypothetical protein CKAH01_14159 [Colletotrichum kahawae]|uniref:Uncharacterized protein n=1 Tax=Colletotrichum kahawae TaxID=34407 RepID=A0AAD9YLU2_COLKA|nr:hypothetical protein CKAH01_14159 [Colletotrichum kahawae]